MTLHPYTLAGFQPAPPSSYFLFQQARPNLAVPSAASSSGQLEIRLLWEAFPDPQANRSLLHAIILFVSFWPLAMTEIPLSVDTGEVSWGPDVGQTLGATIHLPRPAGIPTVPQRRAPASSPHPPPPLPRLPRSGDVSDPVPAAAASSAPARSRRPPRSLRSAWPWIRSR